jgi:hypothetical protein
MSSFSSLKISAIIEHRRLRVSGNFQYHSRGELYSLVRDIELSYRPFNFIHNYPKFGL